MEFKEWYGEYGALLKGTIASIAFVTYLLMWINGVI